MNKPYPVIETKRLRLRAFKIADIARLVQLAGDPDIAKTTANLPHPYTEHDAIDWLSRAYRAFQANTGYSFAVALRPTDDLIGGMGLHPRPHHQKAEAGYWIGKPYWGQGYATEALEALMRYGFEEIGLNKIYAHHHAVNPASGRVMIKNGMLKEGDLAEHVLKDGKFEDVALYGITRKQYQANKDN